MKFDPWEFPEKCKQCGSYSNYCKNEPFQILDCQTKLCEFCFEENICPSEITHFYEDENLTYYIKNSTEYIAPKKKKCDISKFSFSIQIARRYLNEDERNRMNKKKGWIFV
jgi:hypothetical protein